MKSMVKLLASAIIAVVLVTACSKKNITPETTAKAVTVETALQPGDTYNLDLSAYSERNAESTITKEPANAAMSKLTTGTCQHPGSYSYTAGSSASTDQVVLRVVNRSQCKKSEEVTTITLNITVTQPATTSLSNK